MSILAAVPAPKPVGAQEDGLAQDAFDERWSGATIRAEHWHFHRQLFARYDVVLAPGDFSDMLHGLRTGRAVMIERKARGRAVYRWRVKSSHVVIFVLANRHMVFSAWPLTPKLRALGHM